MPRCSIKRVSLLKHVRPPQLTRLHPFHVSAPSHSTSVLFLADHFVPPTHVNDPRTSLVATKYADLRNALSWTDWEPNRVWGCYIDLLNLLGFEKLPLVLHQAVLRKCTPPTNTLRVALSRRIADGKRRGPVHLHEVRFRGIIRNIRTSGWDPSLDDYNFILEQFAAVGHNVGAMEVFDEITQLGLKKTPRTYGLCLQAICHRLSLPCFHMLRPALVSDVTRSCVNILDEMAMQDVPFTSVNVDLVVRVLKETADLDGFERLMRLAYGVDLSYPDRAPLEHWNKGGQSVLVVEDASPIRLPEPLPFSTAALNTTIDMLGSHGQVSKLVQAFEVLTTPLPSGSSGSPSFDEEDEDDFGVLNPRVAPYAPRHAAPNTHTYHMLIKWVSRAGHAVFARHYVLQAMRLDREEDLRLRRDCLRGCRGQILAPHFGINRSMLLSVFAEANRDKNMELMRWVRIQTTRVLRRKRGDVSFYRAVQRKWQDADAAIRSAQDAQLVSEPSTGGAPAPDVAEDTPTNTPPRHSSVFSTFFSPSSSASNDALDKTVTPPPTPYFDVDLDAPPVRELPPPKNFDIALHLSILQREVDSLAHFECHVLDIIGRTTQRVKERLGRRVWGGKDVYMSDQGRRVTVTRDEWRHKVQFRSERASPPRAILVDHDGARARGRDMVPHLRPGSISASRGLMTSALCLDGERDFWTWRDPRS